MININLNRRERLVVIGAAVFIGVFVIFQLLVAPVFEKRNELESKLTTKRQMVEQMRSLRARYRAIEQKSEEMENQVDRRPGDFTLFSFLDRLAGNSEVKQHITYMKPSSSVDEDTGLTMSYVEMKLQDVTLEDLTRFLHRVETSENMVRVSRLSISKSGRTDDMISAVMQMETVKA
ncbi:MAG: type II secretion system protein GspM [Thermodesulfobacteriota bacterium]